MPTETKIAARRPDGAELYYHQATLPSLEVVATYEQYYNGAAREMVEMAKSEQAQELTNRDRDSRLEFTTRILGMTFAFVLTLAIIIAGVVLLCHNHSFAGSFSLAVGIISVIGCLATGGKKMPTLTKSND